MNRMLSPIFTGSRRKRLILASLPILAAAVSVIGVQAAGGASSHGQAAGHSRSTMSKSSSAKTSTHQEPHGVQKRPSTNTGSLTPENQPALDTAASDAQSIAGDSYYAGAAVDDDANTVDVYLASAPESVIDQLNAAHPGVYVIHNDAPSSRSTVLALGKSLDIAELASRGVAVDSWGPTEDGQLQVGVTSDVAAAQSKFDSMYGTGVIRVYKAEPIHLD